MVCPRGRGRPGNYPLIRTGIVRSSLRGRPADTPGAYRFQAAVGQAAGAISLFHAIPEGVTATSPNLTAHTFPGLSCASFREHLQSGAPQGEGHAEGDAEE